MNTPTTHARLVKLILLSTFVALAAIVGLAPAGFFLQCTRLLYVFALEGMLIAGVFLFSQRSETPVGIGASPLEFLLRGLAAVSLWGFLGVVWLTVYELIYWLIRLVDWLIKLLGSKFTLGAASIAFYVSLGCALVFGIGIAAAIAQNISKRLYSLSVSSRTVAYSQALSKQRKTYLYLMLSLLFLAGTGILLWRTGESEGFWFYFVLQLIPYGACFWVLGLGVRVRKDSEIVNAIGMLLRSMGYELVFSPHSQDSTIETLLSGVDMIASRENQVLIIQVKTASSSAASVDWTIGSGLRMKVKALRLPEICQKVEAVSLTDKNVQPLLVLAGRNQDDSLVQFSREVGLTVVVIEMETINEILTLADSSEAEQASKGLAKFGNLATSASEVLPSADSTPSTLAIDPGERAQDTDQKLTDLAHRYFPHLKDEGEHGLYVPEELVPEEERQWA